ncbi:hypothetical protein J19TS2_07490 [Cohnella xylanilytica]|uniref:hypothetical protein n=1 Tax=Cohnella xylanilytica TaxID=557555 RepID=UPI001B1165AE|nr:hypothetical protein [Cohnella xylanilytica]GIO11194.1 hypothetical protein J19TS2_07490 [Cohnella xylanilytica]
MKRQWLLVALMLCLVGTAAACGSAKEARDPQSTNGKAEEKYANLNLRVIGPKGERVVGDRSVVRKAMDILSTEPETNSIVSMSRPADYRIETINTSPTVSYEPLEYHIWLSPKKDILEVVKEPSGKYWALPEKDSRTLLGILSA